MSIYAASKGYARRFVIADSLAPLVALLEAIVEQPRQTARQYESLWVGQHDSDKDYFNRIRSRYNEQHNPVDLLYLVCRCVKNSIRFNPQGEFNQSVDRRRLGMQPSRMQRAITGVSAILKGRTEFRVGDWRTTTEDAQSSDFVYMDPPYLGTSVGHDRRYFQQLSHDDLVRGLADLGDRRIPFALSYDGTTGGRAYGPPLPKSLGLTQLSLNAGVSSQATLNGRREETIESLYLAPGLASIGEGFSLVAA